MVLYHLSSPLPPLENPRHDENYSKWQFALEIVFANRTEILSRNLIFCVQQFSHNSILFSISALVKNYGEVAVVLFIQAKREFSPRALKMS